jgi:hypothetical protein
MDQAVHKLLTDKLYDKRKNGAFEYVNPLSYTVSATASIC